MHENADLDALGSALALSEVFDLKVSSFGGLDRFAKAFSESHSIDIEEIKPSEVDAILLLDAPTTRFQHQGRVIIIDHHSLISQDQEEEALRYCDPTRGSCSEMVYELVDDKELGHDTVIALLAGILSDTGSFKYSDLRSIETYMAISRMYSILPKEVYETFNIPKPKGMRSAVLKAAQRLQFEKYKGFYLVRTQVSAFESSVAMSILGMGTDVVIVASQREDEVRLSGRANRKAVEAGVHLGNLFGEMGTEIGGDGGGHDGAAGLVTKGDAEAILNISITKLKKQF